jgi:hypothetical protein
MVFEHQLADKYALRVGQSIAVGEDRYVTLPRRAFAMEMTLSRFSGAHGLLRVRGCLPNDGGNTVGVLQTAADLLHAQIGDPRANARLTHHSEEHCHLITSPAADSSVGGMSTPSALTFIAVAPNPSIMWSIPGQGRASQQMRTAHVSDGSFVDSCAAPRL